MDQNEDTNKTLRTMENGQWYWISKSLIQNHAVNIGPIGIAVYNILASMADQQQECFPSQKYIGVKLGYSRATINKTLKVLKDQGLIEVKRRNRYHLSYRLIDPRCQIQETEMSMGRNQDVISRNTNNNQPISINNYIDEHKKRLISNEHQNIRRELARTREELVAADIASGLKDSKNMLRFINLAKKYPESVLRRALSEIREVPDHKIKKSRTALYNYLIKEYATRSFSSD